MKAFFSALLLCTGISVATFAQSVPTTEPAAAQNTVVLPPFDRTTVWEGVRIKTEEIFQENNVQPAFKIKSDKVQREQLVNALEGQFQVNIAEAELRSLKRANDLTDYLYQAQYGAVVFSKTNFKGKVERFISDRKECDDPLECFRFAGSMTVPKGLVVVLYSQAKFKGEQLMIDASNGAVSIPTFFKVEFSGPISTTDASLNWREAVQSIRVKVPKDFPKK